MSINRNIKRDRELDDEMSYNCFSIDLTHCVSKVLAFCAVKVSDYNGGS